MQPLKVERVARIELAASAWKAEVLPLYDTRIDLNIKTMTLRKINGGGGWIRTTEAYAADLQSAPFGHSGTPPKSDGEF